MHSDESVWQATSLNVLSGGVGGMCSVFEGRISGMLFPLLGELPLTGMFFGGCAVMRISHEKFFGATPNFLGNFAIGGVAVLEQERSRIQGPMDVFRKLRKHGVRKIYRGTFATILRDFFGCGLYLAVYESIKWVLMDRNTTKMASSHHHR
uniref:Uncharacterized protein n=1 Tax=Ditylenchus dipsaci TaxID=166011 RepID=A0A915D8P3_9BILA